jgi:hypothetical protein
MGVEADGLAGGAALAAGVFGDAAGTAGAAGVAAVVPSCGTASLGAAGATGAAACGLLSEVRFPQPALSSAVASAAAPAARHRKRMLMMPPKNGAAAPRGMQPSGLVVTPRLTGQRLNRHERFRGQCTLAT